MVAIEQWEGLCSIVCRRVCTRVLHFLQRIVFNCTVCTPAQPLCRAAEPKGWSIDFRNLHFCNQQLYIYNFSIWSDFVKNNASEILIIQVNAKNICLKSIGPLDCRPNTKKGWQNYFKLASVSILELWNLNWLRKFQRRESIRIINIPTLRLLHNFLFQFPLSDMVLF